MTNYQFFTLPDGRKLSYTEFWKKDGQPVFYFHGAPSSCVEPLLIGNEKFIEHNIRVISPNRPGIGHSDFQNNRGFIDWPDDVVKLANHLNIEKFSVLGNSGGGGYVIACAAKIPERLLSAVVISGGWQMNLPETKKHLRMPFSIFWMIASRLPFLLPFILGTMKSSGKESREKSLAQFKKMMPAPDFEAVKQNDRLEILSEATTIAVSNKKGAAWDLRLYLKSLNIDLQKIHFPITFFHGELDMNLPIQIVKKMVPQIPNAKLISFNDESHLSTLCNHFDEVAVALVNNKHVNEIAM